MIETTGNSTESGQIEYEITGGMTDEGGLAYELIVNGQTLAEATASPDVLEATARYGLQTQQEMANELKRALRRYLTRELDKVSVTDVAPDPEEERRWVGTYLYQQREHVRQGQVWYDLKNGNTGPDEAPNLVKNMMRSRVHEELSDRRDDTGH